MLISFPFLASSNFEKGESEETTDPGQHWDNIDTILNEAAVLSGQQNVFIVIIKRALFYKERVA